MASDSNNVFQYEMALEVYNTSPSPMIYTNQDSVIVNQQPLSVDRNDPPEDATNQDSLAVANAGGLQVNSCETPRYQIYIENSRAEDTPTETVSNGE